MAMIWQGASSTGRPSGSIRFDAAKSTVIDGQVPLGQETRKIHEGMVISLVVRSLDRVRTVTGVDAL